MNYRANLFNKSTLKLMSIFSTSVIILGKQLIIQKITQLSSNPAIFNF